MCLPQGFGLRSRLNICFWKWTASALTSLTFIASRLNSNYTAWQFTYLKNHKGQMHNPLASSAISWVTTVFLPRPEEKTCYNSYPNPISQLLHCIFCTDDNTCIQLQQCVNAVACTHWYTRRLTFPHLVCYVNGQSPDAVQICQLWTPWNGTRSAICTC